MQLITVPFGRGDGRSPPGFFVRFWEAASAAPTPTSMKSVKAKPALNLYIEHPRSIDCQGTASGESRVPNTSID